MGQLRRPWGVAVDSESRLLYVSEVGIDRISVISLEDGEFVRCFESKGIGCAEMFNPRGLHFDAERKLLFVADGFDRVKVMSSDGFLVRTLGTADGNGDDDKFRPWDVTVDATRGEVFIADMYEERILVFSLEGGRIIRSFDCEFSTPAGVWMSAYTGRLYVTERRTPHVYIFE